MRDAQNRLTGALFFCTPFSANGDALPAVARMPRKIEPTESIKESFLHSLTRSCVALGPS